MDFWGRVHITVTVSVPPFQGPLGIPFPDQEMGEDSVSFRLMNIDFVHSLLLLKK